MRDRVRVFIRTDSSVFIGSGHVMRCLTLAGYLREAGAEVTFICRDLQGAMCDVIEQKGFTTHRLEPDNFEWNSDAEQTIHLLKAMRRADWLIVDHYSIDRMWENSVRSFVKRIGVIDDLADRRHDCDALLDQNFYLNFDTRYNGLLPDDCRTFLGSAHALLRPEFVAERSRLNRCDGVVRRILLFFGGGDPDNVTGKALQAIMCLNRPDISVDVVVGQSHSQKKEVENICAGLPNFNYYCQTDNMAELMRDADLAIGAGGSAAWERCFMGLPTLTVVIADNQIETTKAVASVGACKLLGWHEDVQSGQILGALEAVLADPEYVSEMGKRAMQLMSGWHGTDNASFLSYIMGAAGVGKG